jgi:transcriptional regulator with XRE-family HTH domain
LAENLTIGKSFDIKPIGLRIKFIRKQRGLTLKQLGERIGRTYTALSKIENGINQPEKATLIALAKELKSSFGEKWLKEFAESSNSPADTEADVQRIAAMFAEGMQASGFDELEPSAKEDVLADLQDIARMRIERERQRQEQRGKKK